MLGELEIRNFAIIEHAHLRLQPGLNVLTGETGAGKSIVVDALSAVLGERTSPEVVRAGETCAIIEAFFELDSPTAQRLAPLLAEQGLQGDDPHALVLSREIRAEGRSIARVNGRVTAAGIARQIGELLVDIHGQSEHLSLLRPSEHLNLLDRFAQLLPLRERFAALARELSQVRQRMRSLQEDTRERLRRQERLEYELAEIQAARLRPGEEEELRAERNRLANAEKLLELASEAYAALYGEPGAATSAAEALGRAAKALKDIARIDASLASTHEAVEELLSGLRELAARLRDYQETLEFNPARLEEVEQRLALIANLRRKYGATVEDIMSYAERAAAELSSLAHSEEELEECQKREATLLDQLALLAQELSLKRQEAAARLALALEQELAELAMEKARFAVHIVQREAPDGLPIAGRHLAFDQTGVDQVEFLLAPNPGEPPRPLARIASGGEMARIMLALKGVLSQADERPTLIFDEIDAGIGGRMGRVLGQKLKRLAQHHQVICVTHLPQLAAFASHHLRVQKAVARGRTITTVTALGPQERVEELASMLGGATEANRRSALEMLEQAGHSLPQLAGSGRPAPEQTAG